MKRYASYRYIFRIVAIYAIFGGLWIYLSDTILALFIRDQAVIIRISIYKGGVFIALTSTLLFVLINRYRRQLVTSISNVAQSDALLRQSEERMRLFFERQLVGMAITSPEKGWLQVNDKLCQLLGYDRDELAQHTWAELTHPDDLAADLANFHRLLSGEIDSYFIAKRFIRKDGTLLFSELSVGCVRRPDGSVDYVLALLEDVTEREQLQEQLLTNQKLESLGVLAGGIAHDFNNILTAIMGNISYARKFITITDKPYQPLLEAEKASVRAAELARQLLTFARGGEPVKLMLPIQPLMRDAVTLMLHGSNVKGVVDAPVTVHAVKADGGQVSQLLHNLIINAVHAMPDGGELTVSACNENLSARNPLALSAGPYVRIDVRDQGCGMAPDILKRIFDPYFTTKSNGNGLGLASAYSIARRHDGTIAVVSQVGQGSTFSVYLPSTGAPYKETSPAAAGPAPVNHSGDALLIMDDEELIRNLAAEMLTYLGYQTVTCCNGSEAVSLYQNARDAGTPFAAVLMDLTIPGGMGGKEAAQQILALDPQACLIVSSGYSGDQIMSDYSSYGFSGAIAKPYKLDELGRAIAALLAGRPDRPAAADPT